MIGRVIHVFFRVAWAVFNDCLGQQTKQLMAAMTLTDVTHLIHCFEPLGPDFFSSTLAVTLLLLSTGPRLPLSHTLEVFVGSFTILCVQ